MRGGGADHQFLVNLHLRLGRIVALVLDLEPGRQNMRARRVDAVDVPDEAEDVLALVRKLHAELVLGVGRMDQFEAVLVIDPAILRPFVYRSIRRVVTAVEQQFERRLRRVGIGNQQLHPVQPDLPSHFSQFVAASVPLPALRDKRRGQRRLRLPTNGKRTGRGATPT